MSNWHLSVLIIVASALSVIVILSVSIVTVAYPENEIPEVLVNWGGIILGFFFGILSTVLTKSTKHKKPEHTSEDGG